jgi:hypothetical protein
MMTIVTRCSRAESVTSDESMDVWFIVCCSIHHLSECVFLLVALTVLNMPLCKRLINYLIIKEVLIINRLLANNDYFAYNDCDFFAHTCQLSAFGNEKRNLEARVLRKQELHIPYYCTKPVTELLVNIFLCQSTKQSSQDKLLMVTTFP